MSDYEEMACNDDVPKAAYSREVEPHIIKIKQLEMVNAELQAVIRNYKDEIERLRSQQVAQPVVNIIIGGQHKD